MSLRVWLPLTKDLRNQGLSDCAVEEITSPVFDSNGKLGKALSEGKIRIPASKVGDIFNNNTMTVAFWYNNNTSNTSGNHAICGFSGNTEGDTDAVRIWDFFNYSVPTQFHWSMGTLGGGSLANAFPANTWVHVCVTWSAPTLKIYLDGVLKYTGSGSSNYTFNKSYYISFGHTPQKLNDFRIYDHCLSPMEVKELAKGLILHYPLNRGGFGQENLLHNTFDFTGRSASNTTIVTDSTDGTYAKTTPSTVDWTSIQIGPTFAASLISGKTITVTCEIRAFDLPTSTTTNYCYLTLNAFNSANSFSRTGNKDHSYASNVLKEGEWVTLSYQLDVNFNNWTVGSGYTTSDFQYITLGLYNHSGKRIDFRHPKLELGSIATPWCPNSSDTLATTMGLNSTTEYDCSGFCNNGTRTGTLTWTSNTPKYAVSTHIGTTSSKIHVSNFPTSGFGNSYSFAWWGKRSSNSPMFWGFSDGIRLNGMYLGTLWNTGDSSNNPIYKPNTTTTITAPSTGVWHHYVMTGDGTTCKLYLDGELYGQAKTYKAISGTSIYINGWDSGTQYCSDNTDISDFRIYATALSADDVLSLYQNCATIDPDGTIRGQIRS